MNRHRHEQSLKEQKWHVHETHKRPCGPDRLTQRNPGNSGEDDDGARHDLPAGGLGQLNDPPGRSTFDETIRRAVKTGPGTKGRGFVPNFHHCHKTLCVCVGAGVCLCCVRVCTRVFAALKTRTHATRRCRQRKTSLFVLFVHKTVVLCSAAQQRMRTKTRTSPTRRTNGKTTTRILGPA